MPIEWGQGDHRDEMKESAPMLAQMHDRGHYASAWGFYQLTAAEEGGEAAERLVLLPPTVTALERVGVGERIRYNAAPGARVRMRPSTLLGMAAFGVGAAVVAITGVGVEWLLLAALLAVVTFGASALALAWGSQEIWQKQVVDLEVVSSPGVDEQLADPEQVDEVRAEHPRVAALMDLLADLEVLEAKRVELEKQRRRMSQQGRERSEAEYREMWEAIYDSAVEQARTL